METNATYILALDVGQRRIGLALAHPVAAIPAPLTTLENNDTLWQELESIIEREQVGTVVVGLPRGMQGQDTEQTAYVQQFAKDFEKRFGLSVHLQDEAVTSIAAEDELRQAGKGYNKGMVDAQAAAIILQDYLGERQ